MLSRNRKSLHPLKLQRKDINFGGTLRAVTYIKYTHAITRLIFSFHLQVVAYCLQLIKTFYAFVTDSMRVVCPFYLIAVNYFTLITDG